MDETPLKTKLLEAVNRTLDSQHMEYRVRHHWRVVAPVPGDTFVRRELTGRSTLILDWRDE